MKNSNSNIRIRTLLNELGITQTEFCKKTGITKSALSNYLKGDRVPRQDQISKIADAYDINPAWLMGYDIPMSTTNDLFMERIIKDEFPRQTREIVDYIKKYKALFKAADGCTQEQINIATETLKAFKTSNKTKEE